MRCRFFAAVCVTALGLSACAGGSPVRQGLPEVAEAWMGPSLPEDEIDSTSIWRTAEGRDLVVATAKSGDRLRFFDARDGRLVHTFGTSGTAPGQFRAPNGIAIDGNLAFVVERDGQRVQVLDLANERAVGSFGESLLRKPYGLWLLAHGNGTYHVFVTDSFHEEDWNDTAMTEAGHRVKSFAVHVDEHGVSAELERSFGSDEGDGRLHYVESVWGDPVHNRLLIADEHPEHYDIKVYDLSGRFTGQRIGKGLFNSEPEGITLVRCAGDGGYWLVSDQDPEGQVFRLFDRETLAPVGAFEPSRVHMVDGIWFQPGPVAGFEQGALFTQHDNEAVAAFDWRSIASALSLREGCGVAP